MELTVSLNWTWPGIEGEEWPRFRSSEASCWGNVRTTVMAGLISMLFFGRAVQLSHWVWKMEAPSLNIKDVNLQEIRWNPMISLSVCFATLFSKTTTGHGTESRAAGSEKERRWGRSGYFSDDSDTNLLTVFWRCLCSLSYTEIDWHLFQHFVVCI